MKTNNALNELRAIFSVRVNNKLLLICCSLMLMLFSNCTQQKPKGYLIYGLQEGTLIAKANEDNIEWVIDKKFLKGNLMQLVYQIPIIQIQHNPDTLIFKGMEIINDEGKYHLNGYFQLDKNQTLTLSLGLKKDDKNNLTLYLDTNDAGNKTIEGCMSNDCALCKFTKGKGCSCSSTTSGKCGHIIIEISIL